MYSHDDLVFRVGNTRIIVMENFEALGRYITAKEQAEKFAKERNGYLFNASKLIDKTSAMMSSGILAYDFDAVPIQDLINKAAEAHQNLITAVNEANRQADDCGKPKLKIESVR